MKSAVNFSLRLDGARGELDLVRGGKRAYLWIGIEDNNGARIIGTVSGAARLERFARAILKELKPKPRKGAR